MSESEFALAISKERARCDRRPHDRAFVLIVLYVEELIAAEKKLLHLCSTMSSRLRITDEIGWQDGNLCFLLPETHREGGEQVAIELNQRCFELDLKLDSQVLVYPDDDDIASKSYELESQFDTVDVQPPTVDESAESLESDSPQPVNESNEPVQNSNCSITQSIPTPFWKRSLDVIGAAFALIVCSPLFILATLAIKLDSPGPIVFRQKREGKDGRIFDILKFRTMRMGAENEQTDLRERAINEQDGPAFKLTDDPRVTRVGRYMRKICLDELPQMINVLRGDMSLVGPRPLPIGESYGSKVWHRRRLEVLPGLTCIWQVQGRRDIEFDEWMRMDMEYIRRRGICLDLQLLFQTALVVILHRGSV